MTELQVADFVIEAIAPIVDKIAKRLYGHGKAIEDTRLSELICEAVVTGCLKAYEIGVADGRASRG